MHFTVLHKTCVLKGCMPLTLLLFFDKFRFIENCDILTEMNQKCICLSFLSSKQSNKGLKATCFDNNVLGWVFYRNSL